MRIVQLATMALLFVGLLIAGCGEEKTTVTEPNTGLEVDKGPMGPEIQPIDPDDWDSYIAGVEAILNIPVDDPRWIEYVFQLDPKGDSGMAVINASGWGPGSVLKVEITPKAGAVLPRTVLFKVYLPLAPQNFGRATVFRFADYPVAHDVEVYLESPNLDLPTIHDDYVATTFVCGKDDENGPLEVFDYVREEYPNAANMYMLIKEYDKPEGHGTGGTYDPSNPPGCDTCPPPE